MCVHKVTFWNFTHSYSGNQPTEWPSAWQALHRGKLSKMFCSEVPVDFFQLSAVQFETDDECAWDDIEFVMLSKYCTTLMSPEETLVLFAFYPVL